MSGDKDLALCDASSGGFTLTLPDGSNAIIGKPYTVKEWEGSNAVTIDPAGAGTIDGAANLVLAASEAVTLVPRAINSSTYLVTWAIVSQTAPNPGVGGELLAANNLSDVADASTSAQNIGALEAANNLSDVDTPATARANIGANRKTVLFTRIDLVGATGAVYRYVNVSGNSETVLAMGSALAAALTTGDATITASINATPITDGAITITQSSSGAGDIDTATPSAANVIANGEALELTVGGTNDAAVFADVTVELSY